MRADIFAIALLALGLSVATAGCHGTTDPERTLRAVVFHYDWIGDIDKIGFNEPSGICWHAARKTLFVVGDEGDLAEITPDGTLVQQKHIRAADFEGVTYDPGTGLVYLGIEEEEAVLEVDPDTFAVLREFTIPRTFQGKTMLRAGGEGIEAITFIPDAKHREGGVFYVANQAFGLTDEQDVSAVFQVELPLRTHTGQPRITGYFAPGIIDLSGLYYDPATDHILLISDATNLILEYARDHRLLSVQAFPGDNQEGITVDDDNFLYIAQDSGGIVKLKWHR